MNDMKFNGPVSVGIKIYVINDDTGATGQVTIGSVEFKYPTPHEIEEAVAKFTSNKFTGELEGFRLMTKTEAVNAVVESDCSEWLEKPSWDELPPPEQQLKETYYDGWWKLTPGR